MKKNNDITENEKKLEKSESPKMTFLQKLKEREKVLQKCSNIDFADLPFLVEHLAETDDYQIKNAVLKVLPNITILSTKMLDEKTINLLNAMLKSEEKCTVAFEILSQNPIKYIKNYEGICKMLQSNTFNTNQILNVLDKVSSANQLLSENIQQHLRTISNNVAYQESQSDLAEKIVKLQEGINQRRMQQKQILKEQNETKMDGTKEKTDQIFFDELEGINVQNTEIREQFSKIDNDRNSVFAIYQKVITFYAKTNENNQKPFKQYSKEDIQQWSKEILQDPKKSSNFLSQLLAGICQVNFLTTGHIPRFNQITSVILLLLCRSNHGRLLEIKTGEGKSTICSMLAAMLALQGYKVDVITSNSVLAIRDAEKRLEFFEFLNLSVAHNCDDAQSEKFKDCYSASVVYGDTSHFMGDYLRDIFKGFGTRGNRPFDFVIIDEVDSLIIDENNKIVKLSFPIPGIEYLHKYLVMIWSELERCDKQIVIEDGIEYFINGFFEIKEEKIVLIPNPVVPKPVKIPTNELTNFGEFRRQHLIDCIKHFIKQDKFELPLYLFEYAYRQVENWVNSALAAKNLHNDAVYIIKDDKDRSIITPVDRNNGTIQDNTQCQDGLHQFLQLKHHIPLTNESLTTCFISNFGYFKLYGTNIYGMTGTLGSKHSQQMFKDIYGFDLAFIPTFNENMFLNEGYFIANEEKEWENKIVNEALTKAEKRAVLIICQTIKIAKYFQDLLFQKNYRSLLFTRNDTDENLTPNILLEEGTVVISTNIGGRGTDFKINPSVNESGGLHVIFTYFPENERTELQGFGRAARQGCNGSGCMILLKSDILKYCTLSNSLSPISFEDIKVIRDKCEQLNLEKIKAIDLKNIETNDKLFSMFCEFFNKIRRLENNKSKLLQLEELWGFELHAIQQNLQKSINEEKIEHEIAENEAVRRLKEFQSDMEELYFQGYKIICNPTHLILQAINTFGNGNRYEDSMNLLKIAVKHKSFYVFAAFYALAYAAVQQDYMISMQKGKIILDNHKDAIEALVKAKDQLENIVLPHFEFLAIHSGAGVNSELSKQFQTKIYVFKEFLKFVDSSIQIAQNRMKNHVAKVGNRHSVHEYFKIHEQEIMNLNINGLYLIYDIELVELKASIWDQIFVGVIGFVQCVVGTIAIASGNPQFGVNLIMNGIKDLQQSSDVNINFNWKEYYLEKAISCAINTISYCNTSIENKLGISKYGSVGEGFLKSFLTKTVIDIGLDNLAKNVAKNCAKEFEKEIIKSVTSKVRNLLFNEYDTAYAFKYIIAIDQFKNSSSGINEIFAAVSDALTRKSKLLNTVISKLNFLTQSSNSTVKAVGHILEAGKTINDIHEISNFADNVCDTLRIKILHIQQKMPSIKDLLSQNIVPNLTEKAAQEVIQILQFKNIMPHDIFGTWNTGYLENLNIKNEEQVKIFITKAESVFTKNFDQEIQNFGSEIISVLSTQLNQMIRHQIIYPVIQTGVQMSGIRDIVAEKILTTKTFSQLFAAENFKTNNTKPIAIAAGDEDIIDTNEDNDEDGKIKQEGEKDGKADSKKNIEKESDIFLPEVEQKISSNELNDIETFLNNHNENAMQQLHSLFLASLQSNYANSKASSMMENAYEYGHQLQNISKLLSLSNPYRFFIQKLGESAAAAATNPQLARAYITTINKWVTKYAALPNIRNNIFPTFKHIFKEVSAISVTQPSSFIPILIAMNAALDNVKHQWNNDVEQIFRINNQLNDENLSKYVNSINIKNRNEMFYRLISPFVDITEYKPKPYITLPPHFLMPTKFYTPNEGEKLNDFSKLPGYEWIQNQRPQIEGFPDHSEFARWFQIFEKKLHDFNDDKLQKINAKEFKEKLTVINEHLLKNSKLPGDLKNYEDAKKYFMDLDLLKEKNGKIIGLKGCETHHMMFQCIPEAKKILQKFVETYEYPQMRHPIDHPSNKIILIGQELKDFIPELNIAVHNGRHSKLAQEEVEKNVKQIFQLIIEKKDKEAFEILKAWQANERKLLINGSKNLYKK